MKLRSRKLAATGLAVMTLVLVATYIILGRAQTSYADPLGGNSDANKTGGCSDRGTNCTSWGVTWVKQPLDEFLQSANRVGLSNKQKQDMIDNCNGMQQPYVYRLAYVDFANGGKIQLDSVSGLLSNSTAGRNNAVFIDPATIPGGLTKAEAENLYNYALSIGVNMEYDWAQMAIFAFDEVWRDCPPGSAACPDPEPATGGAMPFFQAKTIVDTNGGIPEGPQDSGWDGHKTIEFSTDSSSVSIIFRHVIEYQPNGFSIGGDDAFTTAATAGEAGNPPAIADVADTVNNYTNYSITGDGSSGTFGTFTTGSGSRSFTVTKGVSLSPGDTQTVCSNISYNGKFANISSKKHVLQKYEPAVADDPATPNVNEHKDAVPEISHMDWYLSGYSGSGSSSGCVTVTRPYEPDGGPVNPSGGTTADVMFAGETTNLAWNISAPTYDTRRLMERQITGHLVSVIPGRDGRYFIGNARSGSDPYGYYSGGYVVARQNFGNAYRNIGHAPDSYGDAFGVVVPDNVGYKYCHTGGYRYESWYSIDGNWSQDTRGGKNYWFVYNASCRVIAKKPSVAVWNGSLMTAGGVTTSTSPRFNNAVMGTLAGNGGPRTLFGSWTEYLGAVNGNVNGFASGSSLAVGSASTEAPKSPEQGLVNSPLTIANKGQLGGSGIVNNSTYRTRVETFLESRAERRDGNAVLDATALGAAETKILSYNGGLTITGNIISNAGPYASIYHIPKMVIFVHGDLNIASNVTQIDAWLFVDGRINTCRGLDGTSRFIAGETQSDTRDTAYPACTNQLVFNGPVMASGIEHRRSFGSDALVPTSIRTGTFGTASTKQAAGEIFNFRLDNYLWAYAQAGRYDSSYTESYSRELAPRY